MSSSKSFASADNLLKNDLGVQVSLNDCGAEVWYSGVSDQISAFLTATDGITVDTGASEEIRNAIFDLQDIRRNITVTAPECVSTATSHLFASVDAGIGLLQAIMSSDSEDKRRQITIMTRERDAFFQEMNALNVPVVIQ